MKLVNQLLCSVHLAAGALALTFADSLGLNPATAVSTVRRTSPG